MPSVTKEGLKSGAHIEPTLIVGLGGVAKNVILLTRQLLIGRYGSLEVLPSIAFLHVDTDRNPTMPGMDPRTAFKQSERIEISSYVPHGLDINTLRKTPCIEQWYETGYELKHVNFMEGAGGVRMLGRVAFSYAIEPFRQSIASAVKYITLNEHKIQTAKALSVSAMRNSVQIIVIASFVGGTGSGTFLDACYNIRHVFRATQGIDLNLVGKFIIGANGVTSQSRANFYASLLELNHFMSNRHSPFRGGYPCDGNNQIKNERDVVVDTCFLFNGTNNRGISYSKAEMEEILAQDIFLDFVPGVAEERRARRVDIRGLPGFTAEDKQNEMPQAFFSVGLSILRFPAKQVQTYLAAKFCSNFLDYLYFRNPSHQHDWEREHKEFLSKYLHLESQRSLVESLLKSGNETLPETQRKTCDTEKDKLNGNLSGRSREIEDEIRQLAEADEKKLFKTADPNKCGELLTHVEHSRELVFREILEKVCSRIGERAVSRFYGVEECHSFLNRLQHRLNDIYSQLERDYKTGERTVGNSLERLRRERDLFIRNIKSGAPPDFLRKLSDDFKCARVKYLLAGLTQTACENALLMIGKETETPVPGPPRTLRELVVNLRATLFKYCGTKSGSTGTDYLAKTIVEMNQLCHHTENDLKGRAANSGSLAMAPEELDAFYSKPGPENSRIPIGKEHFDAFLARFQERCVTEFEVDSCFWAFVKRPDEATKVLLSLAQDEFLDVQRTSVAEKISRMDQDNRENLFNVHFDRCAYLVPSSERTATIVSGLEGAEEASHRRWVMTCEQQTDAAVAKLAINSPGFVVHQCLGPADKDKIIFIEEMGIYPLSCLKPSHAAYREAYYHLESEITSNFNCPGSAGIGQSPIFLSDCSQS